MKDNADNRIDEFTSLLLNGYEQIARLQQGINEKDDTLTLVLNIINELDLLTGRIGPVDENLRNLLGKVSQMKEVVERELKSETSALMNDEVAQLKKTMDIAVESNLVEGARRRSGDHGL